MKDRAFLSAFGKQVHKRRQALELSQEGLAEKCGLHRTYIGGVERGERNPTLTVINRIAEGLGTTCALLLGPIGARRRKR